MKENKMAGNKPAILTNNPLVKEFYDNSQSNIVSINDDKLKVILLEHKEKIMNNNNFLAPMTLLLSFILTFCTTDFKEFARITPSTWQAFYFFCGIASFIWLIIELIKINKTVSIDDLIAKIKNQNANK